MKIESALMLILLLPGCAAGGEKRENPPDIRSLWDYQKPGETRQRFEALLEKVDPEEQRSYTLEVKTQIARTYGLEGDFESAHRLLDEVEATLDEAPAVVRVRYLLERGRAFNSGGKPEEGRPLFLEAWALGKEARKHGLAVDAAHMMAIVETGKASLEWNQVAIDYAEDSGDPTALDWLGSLYNNTGWSYHDVGEYAKALDLWKKGLAWQQERNPGTERERIALYTVGRGLRSLGRHEEALAIQQAILSPEADGYVIEEIAECLHALGREDEARTRFRQAYEILRKDLWLLKNEPERLERMKGLGGVE